MPKLIYHTFSLVILFYFLLKKHILSFKETYLEKLLFFFYYPEKISPQNINKTLLLLQSGNELQRMNEGFVYTRFYYSTKFSGKKTYEIFRICFGNLLCRERAIQGHMERDFSLKIKSLIVRKYYTGCQHS